MKKLELPATHENIREFLGRDQNEYIRRVMEFVQPVDDAERELAVLLRQIGPSSGKAIFLLADPGVGKSTFIESLQWRHHLAVSEVYNIDCSTLDPETQLTQLLREIQGLSERVRKSKGRTNLAVVAIDYLENLEGFAESEAKSFFRSLNGILRNAPLLIVWPVTERQDAETMLNFAASVSGTVFFPGHEIIPFPGPPTRQFSTIAKNTIAVFNEGRSAEDFGITDADLDGLLLTAPTIRKYLEAIYNHWKDQSGFLDTLRSQIPNPTEIWFVFVYPTAEDVVSQFTRRSEYLEAAWTTLHNKLWEYIPNHHQRAAAWTPQRLQLALGGALTTRILFLPTNAVVSAVAAFDSEIRSELQFESLGVPSRWNNPSAAQEHLESTILYRLLINRNLPSGKRKGGPAANALDQAKAAFEAINKYATGSGRDRNLNRCMAASLRGKLPSGFSVASEQAHPWIPGIQPDIRIDHPDSRAICLEFSYSKDSQPHFLAGYVLKKLDQYMRQVDLFIKRGQQGTFGF